MPADVREPLERTLSAAAAALGLSITSTQRRQLLDYAEMLSRWNRTYNLTAIRDLPGILSHHIVDCLSAVPSLRRRLGACPDAEVLDVGSGGGLPGLVFAIMDPERPVTCIDSVGKKTAFLQHAAAALALANVCIVKARVEALDDRRYDLITARAFASLGDLVRTTLRLLARDGWWLAMKGKAPDREIAALPPEVDVFHVERLAVPGLDAERCLVWIRHVLEDNGE